MLNRKVLTELFMQHDTNISNNLASKLARTSVFMWLIRNQIEIYKGVGAEMYGRGRSSLFLSED